MQFSPNAVLNTSVLSCKHNVASVMGFIPGVEIKRSVNFSRAVNRNYNSVETLEEYVTNPRSEKTIAPSL